MPSSLYIHIPFCLSKCAYCDFFSIPLDEVQADAYVHALNKEMSMHPGHSLRTIYIGGGTPTVLSDESLETMFSSLRGHFEISTDAEITIEANPGTVSRQKTENLLSLGVNRVSLGVQSFDDTELSLLGRSHNAREAHKAVEDLMEVFGNVSFDLIYGIPGQTEESLRQTLRSAIDLGPHHISAYELTPEPDTPLIRSLAAGELSMPEDDEIADMAAIVIDTLETAGLTRYEISNYAIPGHECRHNLNYWLRGEYLGLGAGAHAFTAEVRTKSTADIGRYIELVETEESPVDESLALSSHDILKEMIFLGFRLTQGIDTHQFRKETELDIHKPGESFIKDGLMEMDGKYLKLTRQGMMIYNTVVTNFMIALGI